VGGINESTKAISLPVRPPILLNAPPTPCIAPAIAGPAAEVTLDNPSEAFDVAEVAASVTLAAAWDVVDEGLKAGLRSRNRDCRKTARDAMIGIVAVYDCRNGIGRKGDIKGESLGIGRTSNGS